MNPFGNGCLVTGTTSSAFFWVMIWNHPSETINTRRCLVGDVWATPSWKYLSNGETSSYFQMIFLAKSVPWKLFLVQSTTDKKLCKNEVLVILAVLLQAAILQLRRMWLFFSEFTWFLPFYQVVWKETSRNIFQYVWGNMFLGDAWQICGELFQCHDKCHVYPARMLFKTLEAWATVARCLIDSWPPRCHGRHGSDGLAYLYVDQLFWEVWIFSGTTFLAKIIWLVVSTHLKNISQIGNLPQIGWK